MVKGDLIVVVQSRIYGEISYQLQPSRKRRFHAPLRLLIYLNAKLRFLQSKFVFLIYSDRHDGYLRGSLSRAVTASCCVPGLFSPVDIDGEWCMDGGLYDSWGTYALPKLFRMATGSAEDTSANSQVSRESSRNDESRKPLLKRALVVSIGTRLNTSWPKVLDEKTHQDSNLLCEYVNVNIYNTPFLHPLNMSKGRKAAQVRIM